MRKTSLVTILFAMLITFLSACKSDSEEGGTTGKPYDPNQPYSTMKNKRQWYVP